MEFEIKKTPGVNNELVLKLAKTEVSDVQLSVPHWSDLSARQGMIRWRGEDEFKTSEAALEPLKEPMETHLRALHLLDERNYPISPVLAVGNRNLGNNLGFLAWDSARSSPLFCLRGEPLDQRAYGCLCLTKDLQICIRTLSFAGTGTPVVGSCREACSDLMWCTSGMHILSEGRVRSVEELVEDAYDIRHLFALDPLRQDSRETLESIYGKGAGAFDLHGFKKRALQQWRAGAARSRYFHSCVGISSSHVILLLAEGTPEQIAHRVRDLGCSDALILDQGGSAGVWAWWLYRSEDEANGGARGGFLFTSPEYRPRATSIIAFILSGPARIQIPPAAASLTVV